MAHDLPEDLPCRFQVSSQRRCYVARRRDSPGDSLPENRAVSLTLLQLETRKAQEYFSGSEVDMAVRRQIADATKVGRAMDLELFKFHLFPYNCCV